MFDQMKALGALAGLMKNKDRIKEIGEEFSQRLERINVEGSSGGGAVRVIASGKMRVTNVHIDPAAIAGLDSGESGRDMVQALVLEATNDALQRAQELIQEEARRMAQELDLPDIPGMGHLLTGA